ncbi:polysaccharide deacetylase family protein [Pseudoduganella sp. UC29_71]|uniref:polysaccharide deacetylase family protein n=1 Tax=Pseudoduganella sp. UC29_71 TaxID=3350174 RepID=UPI00366E1DA1
MQHLRKWAPCVLSLFLLSPAAAAAGSFDIAITVDDLPVHGPLPRGMSWLGIAETHLKVFKANGVPEAFGFVNASKIARALDGDAVLDAWRAAGYPLGNHTYSHMNLEKAPSLAAWTADVVTGEPAVAARMAGADWRYLRFPFLNAGGERQQEALDYLHAHGYKVADVSVAFSDWVYTDAYARCVAQDDTAAIQAMKAAYLAGVDSAIASMKAQSQQVYGRVIPQVLLTHMGGWSAVTLPEVMAKLNAAGARYVTLAQAQSDPAYTVPGGGAVITRTAGLKGISLQDSKPAAPQLDVGKLCR